MVIHLNLRSQRKMTKSILKVGKNKIWIDPDRISEIDEAITKNDIRRLINGGAIASKPIVGTSRLHARKLRLQKKKGRRMGQGTRRGKKTARTPEKTAWITKIRSLRKELKSLKAKNKITCVEYRALYRKSGAGVFKDKSYLRLYIKKMKE